jgi:transposase
MWGFMIKHTEQFKLSVVEYYLAGAAGFRTDGHHFSLPPAMVRRWVMWHQEHGVAGLATKRSSYSAEFKLSVLQHMWDNSMSYTKVAAVFNVRNTASIGIWESRFRSGGVEALARSSTRKSIELKAPTAEPTPSPDDETRSKKDLLAELRYLRAENAYLKKLEALIQAKKNTATPTKR